ncbi:MAG TPA: hypothetical protein VJC16_00750 [Candidatus Nanoarchaeia archaeon]|nr:hypothetical protein [Candidatus Nanoarchaeia archaeon]
MPTISTLLGENHPLVVDQRERKIVEAAMFIIGASRGWVPPGSLVRMVFPCLDSADVNAVICAAAAMQDGEFTMSAAGKKAPAVL